ncbi:MAG TPA: hypothetical protein VGR21_01275 [Cryptosporangiaceae bacterium]|nr:hypothetical protein [Cryptosporangiaceae bacterium]
MTVTTAIAAWPLKASMAADTTLTGSLGIVNSALHPSSTQDCGSATCVENRSPQRQASGVVTDVVLYRQWLSGELGSADSSTADKYGERLYSASAFTWYEAREIRADPTRREGLIKLKQDKWKEVAAEIKKTDPDAYEYLTGKQGTGRVGSAFTALVAALVTLPFDLMASLLIIVAFLIIRLAVAFLPAIAVVGILRPTSGPLRGLFRTVVAAIMNCVIFGIGASVYLLAIELITGTTTLAGWQQILLIWLTGLVLWLLLRPFRRLTSLTGKDPFAELAGGLGGMHRKFFGDMKQLGIAATGSYLGDVHALDANDQKRAERAAGGQGRPEGWTRQDPAYARSGEAPPGRMPPDGTPGAQRAPAASTFRRVDHAVPSTPGPPPSRPETATGPHYESTTSPHYATTAGQYTTASDPGALPVETSDVYVIYRPDRGYQTVPSNPPAARSSPRVDQAAANVAAAADAVRDLASATASSRRSESPVR